MRKIYKDKINKLERETVMIVESLDNLVDRFDSMEKAFISLLSIIADIMLELSKEEEKKPNAKIKKETIKKETKRKVGK